MSSKKYIGEKEGAKVYLDAMSPQEIRDADLFLESLQTNICSFEKELSGKLSPSSLEYKYRIGEFLSKQLQANNINYCERMYVFEEIKRWVETTIETSKDRGNLRQFYDYCYRLYCFGEELVFSFTWRQWSEFLDRSITTKDIRLLHWLKAKIKGIREDDFRMFLLIINEYLKTRDTSVFDDEELYTKYEFLYGVVECWNTLVAEFFKGKTDNFSKARRENLTKYKKKYVSRVIHDSKFKTRLELDGVCRQVFIELFVDIDNSANFKKS